MTRRCGSASVRAFDTSAFAALLSFESTACEGANAGSLIRLQTPSGDINLVTLGICQARHPPRIDTCRAYCLLSPLPAGLDVTEPDARVAR